MATPSIKLPYPYVTDLSRKAQYQLWRDFEALIAGITPTPGMFDAIIDPALDASIPGEHQYVNLTELVANESWDSTQTFQVGVRQYVGIQIVEPGTIDISGFDGDLALFGIAEPPESAGFVAWDWRAVTTDIGQTLHLTGLSISRTSPTQTSIAGPGTIIARDCQFGDGISGPGSSRNGYFFDCLLFNDLSRGWSISSSGGISITHRFYDCTVDHDFTVGNLTNLVWMGGQMSTGNGTLTIQGTANAVVQGAIHGSVSIAGTGTQTIVENTGATGVSVTVTATSPNVRVGGSWGNVAFSGTPTGFRIFDGDCDDFDFVGPGYVQLQNKSGSGGRRVDLRGVGVAAFVHIKGGVAISGIDLDDSLIVADYSVASTFSLDSSSQRNLCILGGTGISGFGGITDSGTANRIITHVSDSFVGGSATPFGGNILNGEIAAVQSGIRAVGGPSTVDFNSVFMLMGA